MLPSERSRPSPPGAASLPSDLLEGARGRARLLALLIGIAFSVDLAIFGIEWVAALLSGGAPPGARAEELDRLVLDCLAKSPSGRPESARALTARLAKIAAAEPGPT